MAENYIHISEISFLVFGWREVLSNAENNIGIIRQGSRL